MAKKSSNNLSLILKVIILVLGVAAFCMAFVPCVKFVNDSALAKVEESFNGFNSMFGYSETETVFGSEVTSKYLGFSIMSVITFVLPLVGAVLSMMKSKIARLVGAGLMLVGAVLMFFVPSFTVLAKVDGEFTLASAILNGCERSLGIGAILGGVFSALGAVVAGYAVLTKK